MKKLLLLLPLIALLGACNNNRKGWTQDQRSQFRDELRSYRDRVYVSDLTDSEFNKFRDEVAASTESRYPAYVAFAQLDGRNDTVTYMVVTTITNDLEADAHNMRHIFPYNQLRKNGILPEGLSQEQQRSFYACLASKADDYYGSMDAFVDAIWYKRADTQRMRAYMGQCSNSLFDWEITEVDVYEQ